MSRQHTPARRKSSGLIGTINNFLEQWIPSAMTFAMALTVVVAVMALFLTPSAPKEIVKYWGDGLSGTLPFTPQTSLILRPGHILAGPGPLRKVLISLARFPSRPAAAYLFACAISAVLCFFVWGLGQIAGAAL